jgi:hypothetical protein
VSLARFEINNQDEGSPSLKDFMNFGCLQVLSFQSHR